MSDIRAEDLTGPPVRDWDSERKAPARPANRRPRDHSGGSPAPHGDLVENVVNDATDDPSDEDPYALR